jgi:hypothetical protein
MFLDIESLHDLMICLCNHIRCLHALPVVGRRPGSQWVTGIATWTCGPGTNWRGAEKASFQTRILMRRRPGTIGTDPQVAYTSIKKQLC